MLGEEVAIRCLRVASLMAASLNPLLHVALRVKGEYRYSFHCCEDRTLKKGHTKKTIVKTLPSISKVLKARLQTAV